MPSRWPGVVCVCGCCTTSAIRGSKLHKKVKRVSFLGLADICCNSLCVRLDHDVAVDENGADDDEGEERVREHVDGDPPDGVERGE